MNVNRLANKDQEHGPQLPNLNPPVVGSIRTVRISTVNNFANNIILCFCFL
uniref:Uncharacterized protein n=1 Tax=Anguilla anguilla TaxID=7936 RepID=A0A0E9SI75_ANGAN